MPAFMPGPLKWSTLHQQDGLHQLAPIPHGSGLPRKRARLENSIQRWEMVAQTAQTGDSAGTYAVDRRSSLYFTYKNITSTLQLLTYIRRQIRSAPNTSGALIFERLDSKPFHKAPRFSSVFTGCKTELGLIQDGKCKAASVLLLLLSVSPQTAHPKEVSQ